MSRRPPHPDPAEPPEKPAAEMTAEERAELVRRARAELRAFDRSNRERRLRRGLAKPRTMGEVEIFGADLLRKRGTGAPDAESSD